MKMLIALSLFTGGAFAQTDLRKTVADLDTALFDSFNRCDAEKFASYFTPQTEFYHDQAGLSIGVESITDALKKNICGKVRRELVAGSMEVHPIPGFGALQLGTHTFHHPGQNPDDPGIAKFAHLWQNKDGVWKLVRVLSYDHKALKN